MRSSQILWLLAVVAAGAGGWLAGRSQREPGSSNGASDTRRFETTGNGSATAGAPLPSAQQLGAESGPQAFLKTLRTPRPADRLKGFLAELDRITPENVEQYRAAWTEFLASGKPDATVAALYNMRMGEVMGARLLSDRIGNPWDFKVMGSIAEEMTGAMRTDPAGVRQWFDGLKNERFREGMFGGYASALALTDLPAAMRLMTSVPPEFRHQCASAVVSAIRQTGGSAGLVDWLRTTLNSPANAEAEWLSEVFDEAVAQTSKTRQSASIGAALLEEYAGKPYADMSSSLEVAGRYAAFKPMEALAWAERMETKDPDQPAGALLNAVIKAAAEPELRAMAEWCIKRNDGPARESAVAALRDRSASLPPEFKGQIESVLGQPPAAK
jgi:hypothetical protein